MDISPLSQEFIHTLPKIELHAHLNGCIRFETLKELSLKKGLIFPFEEHAQRDLQTCFSIFAMIHQVLTDLPSIKRVTREMLEDFSLQNVVYLEIRTTPKSQPELYTYEEYLECILTEIVSFNEKNPMVIRMFFSIDRSRSLEQAEATINLLEKFKAHPVYSKYILGLDYSGNPYKNSFRDFEATFIEARKKGFKVVIHVAETPGEECRKETLEIINFKPHRLGHFNYFDQELFNMVIKSGIPIEVCPSSNFCTVGLKTLKDHHFGGLLKENHPLSICTDDTGVFDTNLSKEMKDIFDAFELDKKSLKKFLKKSLECILEDDVKEIVRKKWEDFFGSDF